MPITSHHSLTASTSPPPGGEALGSRIVTPDGSAIGLTALREIERLDDVIFEALTGDPDALNLSVVLWRKSRDTTPKRLLEDARKHYVRQAKAVFTTSQEDPSRELVRTFAALEILRLLADEA